VIVFDSLVAIAGVVLAAGASTRMGRNKLLLSLGEESILRLCARRALTAGLDPVIAVLGHDAERTGQELSGLPVRLVVNPDSERGINSSLRAGIAAASSASEAAVVLLPDMPFVTAAMIGNLMLRYASSRAPLVVSDYGGVQAPPTLYDRRLFGELAESEGEGCGKRVAARHAGEAAVVGFPPEALADLDSPEDYDRVRAALSARQAPCATTS
jgi:molybdenum cofactor cytidylyltransferase